jgi:DNA-binding MarR family transcriptional regulator
MHDTRNVDALAAALMDLMGCMNSPRQDDVLLREAGVSLDRALFPLLVCLSRSTALGVAELADQMGRDASTISRQIAKLEELGFVQRKTSKKDLRVREAVITKAGICMIDIITSTRRRLLNQLLSDWTEDERNNLPRLIQRLASSMKEKQKL